MIRSIKSSILLLLLMALSGEAAALQVLTMIDGATAVGKISARDANRIAVANGRITEVWGPDNVYNIDKDEASGQIYLRLLSPSQREAVSLFVSDESRNTYTLILTPEDVPAETVMIRRRGDDKRAANAWEKSSGTHNGVLRRLMVTMIKDEVPDGYEVSERGQNVPLWKEASLRLDREYRGAAYVGEVYTLTNTSATEMVTEETEFYRSGVKAVAIEHHRLSPGVSTRLLVIREHSDEH